MPNDKLADKQPKILVIDDNEANRQILENLLQKEGLLPLLAEDGKSGLAAARENLPDLVLLDIFMPGEDGFKVLEEFQKDSRLKKIPVIIFTLLEREESRKKALEMGAKDYITKPFDMRDTVQRILRYL
ncbi:MAG: response regulator [Desulfococcaceae bacterium]|jgi:DNA-binding response OmpR family regulator|nr:response regulator [Desulfococcaceae bacterium]